MSSSTNATNTYVPCTLQTCSLDTAFVAYLPNIGGNAFFTALFSIFILLQLYFGIRHKTWTYTVPMIFGLGLELAGYIARINLHNNPWDFNLFIQYLVCLTIGPAFFCAAIYLTFRRVVQTCESTKSIIEPGILSIIFMTSDFICLVLQAAGGAITATTNGYDQAAQDLRDIGLNVMIAGLALQVVSLALFISYAGFFFWYRQSKNRTVTKADSATHGFKWKALVYGLATAAVAILIRSAYRVAELREGFQKGLASNEPAFMILEGSMIVIAAFCLTVAHPGICLSISWNLPSQRRDKKNEQSRVEAGIHVMSMRGK